MSHSLSSESSRQMEIGKPFTAFRIVLSAWVRSSCFFWPRYHPCSGYSYLQPQEHFWSNSYSTANFGTSTRRLFGKIAEPAPLPFLNSVRRSSVI
ncbi:hypothetical protein VTN96DRAFT_9386 [Rasamsonia emersonii]